LGFTLSANTGNFTPQIRDATSALAKLHREGLVTGNDLGRSFAGADGRMRDAKGRFVGAGASAGKAWSSGFMGALGGGGAGGGGLAGGLLGGLGGLLSGGGIVAGLTAAATEGGRFSQSLALLGKKAGATSGELAQMRAAAMNLGLTSTFDPTQAIEGMTSLSSAGLEVRDVLATIGPTLQFTQAAAGKLSTEQSANLTAQAMAMFNVKASGVGPMLDMMAKSADKFALNVEDLPLGLANASRGTNALGASIDDTLISFGLMRKMMPRVESAGTAVGVAMESLAKKDVQRALKGIGVSVEAAGGKFRPFLDVVGDMLPQMQKMTQVQKAAFLQSTFGADAVQGLGAVFAQLESGIPGANGQILKGADAIGFLRKEMGNSKGALGELALAAGTGFTGSLDRMSAKLKTLKQSVGESIGNAVAPAIDRIGEGIAGAASWFERLPASARASMAQVIVAVGGLAAVFLIAGGPVAALIAGIVAGVAGAKAAIDGNVGGIGDRFRSLVSTVQLVWGAFSQLFSQGGFSGAVRKELNSAENGGIKNFVISAWVWLNRLKAFFTGVSTGFTAGLEAMRPALGELAGAFSGLGTALGLTADVDPGKNKSKWEQFAAIGSKVGTVVAAGLTVLVEEGAKAIRFVTGFVDGLGGWESVSSSVGTAITQVSDVLKVLAASLGMSTGSGATDWFRAFGFILGSVVTTGIQSVTGTIGLVSRAIDGLVHTFNGMKKVLVGISQWDWDMVWSGMREAFFGVVKSILAGLGEFISKFASGIDAVGRIGNIDVGASAATEKIIASLNEGIDRQLEVQTSMKAPLVNSPSSVAAAQQAINAPSPVANANVFSAGAGAISQAAMAALWGGGSGPQAKGPTQVHANLTSNLVVDGQVLASIVKNIMAEEAQRGGGYAPSGG
jgi:TP901 family phage tail tape measure protein